MTVKARKITEMSSIGTANSSIASGDLFVIEDVSANATKSATLSTLRKAVVQGPFADDTAANTGGVQLGQLYYTVTGVVKVRIT